MCDAETFQCMTIQIKSAELYFHVMLLVFQYFIPVKFWNSWYVQKLRCGYPFAGKHSLLNSFALSFLYLDTDQIFLLY